MADKHIVVKEETLTRLQSIAKYGDSMNDVINRVLDHWDKKPTDNPYGGVAASDLK